jgi:hypothetical protein
VEHKQDLILSFYKRISFFPFGEMFPCCHFRNVNIQTWMHGDVDFAAGPEVE